MTCALLSSIDALIVKADAARNIPPRSVEYIPGLVGQHRELLEQLKELRLYVEGQQHVTRQLLLRVNDLSACYVETQPGGWQIAPKMAQRFRPALHRLLDFVSELKSKGERE